MVRLLGVTFRDLPVSTIPLFLGGLSIVFLCHEQFVLLQEGNNGDFLFALMMFGPGCLFGVSFITTFYPNLCRSYLKGYVALISGVEIGIAVYLGFIATQWYRNPDTPHLEPTVVCLTLIIGCLQWSKSKWEKRIKALLEERQDQQSCV